MNSFKKLITGFMLGALAVTLIAPATVSASGGKNVVERAVQVNRYTGQFDTLLAAAGCSYVAGPVGALLTGDGDGGNGITLFAPTDRAFKNLGRALGLGDAGLNPSNICAVDSILGNGTLLKILAYHVYEDGAVRYRTALGLRGNTIDMAVFDEPAQLSGKRWRLKIDGARVILPNVPASNGIIHVVRKVLLPPSVEAIL
jgi:uncharacterized surface protein with fasciclin (FAS1) repeats